MEEPTTTETPSENTGVEGINGVAVDESGRALVADESTQPEEQEGTTAESEPTESSSEQWDEETAAWAEKKGIDLNDPEGIKKAVQSYREAEKQLHKASQERSELQKLVQSGELTPPVDDSEVAQLKAEVAQMRMENQVNNFWNKNPEAREYESDMVEILNQRPHLANDLDALYALARVQSGSDKVQGGKEALERLATKQKASVARGAATTQETSAGEAITPENVDRLVASHDQAWFEKNYEQIRKAIEQ